MKLIQDHINTALAVMRDTDAHIVTADTSRGTFGQAVTALFVAALAASPALSVKDVSTFVGETLKEAAGSMQTLRSYRSALTWRIDAETAAQIRTHVGDPTAYAEDGADFAAVVSEVVAQLGNVPKAYKEGKASEAAAAKEVLNSRPAPLNLSGTLADSPADPGLVALTQAGEAIAALVALGEFDHLEAIMQAALAAMDALSNPQVEEIAKAA